MRLRGEGDTYLERMQMVAEERERRREREKQERQRHNCNAQSHTHGHTQGHTCMYTHAHTRTPTNTRPVALHRKELAECTFAPKINSSPAFVRSMVKSLPPGATYRKTPVKDQRIDMHTDA